LVLDGVMQERRDNLVFAASVLNHDGRNAEQMAHVRLSFSLAALMEVQLRRIAKRLDETIREDRRLDS
jgi:hypothetical protein